MATLKKIVMFLWPILLRAFLLEVEREIQHKLYGKGYSRKSVQTPFKTGKYVPPARTGMYTSPTLVEDIYPKEFLKKKYVFEDRQTAEEVMDRLHHINDTYNGVTVEDFKEMISHRSQFIDTQWGWKNLDAMRLDMVEGGDWSLVLPTPTPIR